MFGVAKVKVPLLYNISDTIFQSNFIDRNRSKVNPLWIGLSLILLQEHLNVTDFEDSDLNSGTETMELPDAYINRHNV